MIAVDSGFLFALADRNDAWHARAVAAAPSQEEGWITTWAVLTEFSHLAPTVASTLPLYCWIERGGLEVMPLGKEELITAIDWITSAMPGERKDFETYPRPVRRHFRLI
jgi:predicted nucleic acid-binding protein